MLVQSERNSEDLHYVGRQTASLPFKPGRSRHKPGQVLEASLQPPGQPGLRMMWTSERSMVGHKETESLVMALSSWTNQSRSHPISGLSSCVCQSFPLGYMGLSWCWFT